MNLGGPPGPDIGTSSRSRTLLRRVSRDLWQPVSAGGTVPKRWRVKGPLSHKHTIVRKQEREEIPMTIEGGLDVHWAQITFDYLDTDTGEVSTGQIRPATRANARRWLAPGRSPRCLPEQLGLLSRLPDRARLLEGGQHE